MSAVRRLLLVSLDSGEPIFDGDLADYQYATVEVYLTHCLRDKRSVGCVDTARLQRAPKGPGQSPGCGGDQVVDCCGRRRIGALIDAVVLGDFGMDTKRDRAIMAG